MRALLGIMTTLGLVSPAPDSTWHEAAPLPQARAGFAAGILGGQMIVAGGTYWSGADKIFDRRVDSYSPHCDCWSPRPAMPVAVSNTASVVVDDTLFVLGGGAAAGASREVYSFDGSIWRHRDDMRLPEPRWGGLALMADRQIYVLVGAKRAADTMSGLATGWTWDVDRPKTGWRPMPVFPGAPRISAGATLFQGKLLVIGGLQADQAELRNLEDIWEYNPRTGHWRRLDDLPEGRRAMAVASSSDGVLLAGGYTDDFRTDTAMVFGVRSGSAAPMPVAIADAPILTMGGRWYITGGETAPHRRNGRTFFREISARDPGR